MDTKPHTTTTTPTHCDEQTDTTLAAHGSLDGLAALSQWVVWKAERRNGRIAKIPYNPSNPSRRASVSNPATWGSYDLARSVAPASGGVGFVFTADDPYVGIDLDRCVHDGQLHPEAEAIVARLGTYTELSPSGQGVHCIGQLGGDSPSRNRTSTSTWGGSFEVYDRARFFTMGLDGIGELVDCEEALAELCEEIFGARWESPKPDSSLGGKNHVAYEDLVAAAEALGGWEERDVDFWGVLMEIHRGYLRQPREVGQGVGWYPTRSDAEAAIVYRFVRNGASDRQIIEFADAHLWKHIERKQAGGGGYLKTTIRNARLHVYKEEGLLSSPGGGWPKKAKASSRWTTDEKRLKALDLVAGQRQAEWVRQVEEIGIKRRTAYRVRDDLIDAGLVRLDGKMHLHRIEVRMINRNIQDDVTAPEHEGADAD